MEVKTILKAALLTDDGLQIRNIINRDGFIEDVTYPSSKKSSDSRNVFDARKRIVIPGMIDCHVHLFGVALTEVTADLRGCKSLRQMRIRLGNHAKKKSKKGWLIGRGWDQDLFEKKRLPTAHDLDLKTSGRPSLSVRICGHIGVLNSAGIERIPSLGRFSSILVARARDGQIEGIVKEEALDHVWKSIPNPPRKLLSKLFLHAQEKALSVGLVGVHCILSDDWENELEVIKSLDRQRRLKLKTSILLPISALSYIEGMTSIERRKSLIGQNFFVLGFKLFADGSLGARTAALLTPYSDESSNSGVLYYDAKYLRDTAIRVKELGLILATHAIGDRAVKQVLEAYKSAGIDSSDGFRIEHASVLSRNLIRAMADVVVSVQPSFISSDYWMADRIGKSRGRFAYPLKSLLNMKGDDLVGGSDSPVESINPIEGICSCRKNTLPRQSLSFPEAIRIYTSNAASKSPITRGIGIIRKGMRSTFVVLEARKLDDFCSSKISAVFVDGKLEWHS